MIVYISNSKNSTREPQLINNVSKVAGYKINSNKSVAFLYSKDKWAEEEILKMTPFTIVANNIKYLGVTLTKQVKDLYDKNFKSSQKMERSPMLMDWQDQYSENDYLAKSNLQIQHNPHQNSNSILYRVRKSNS